MLKKEVNDLWIGDEIYLKKSDRVGIFEGLSKDGKLRIRINNKIIKTSFANAEKHIPPKEDWKRKLENEFSRPSDTIVKKTSTKKHLNANSIDLHLEVLSPELVGSNMQKALDFQLKACQDFIDRSIETKRPSIVIIHGKGEGILKNHVHALLQNYHSIKLYSLINDGGATEIILS